MSLILHDSDMTNGKCLGYYNQSAGYMSAVDELHKQVQDGALKVVCLQSYNPRTDIEYPVWYEVKSYDEKRRYQIVDKCLFYSSHYIGRFSYKGYSIIINPRFGKIFSYLISYATNLYLPLGNSELSYNTKSNAYWLIALLWKALLNRALTTGQIPKGYKVIRKNQKHFRGHLCISKHIHTNMADASRFYCEYKKLSMDNVINRTVRTVYSILKSKGVAAIVGEFEAYDKFLESMGVMDCLNGEQEIENVRYTRLTESYKPVMELSKTILSNNRAESEGQSGKMSEVSYFIDIAELWEMYLLKLLQNNLPSEYLVYSPNINSNEHLLEGNMREIRPDIIIERDGRVVMIIDAKYKNYSQFGRTSQYGVQRDDLYQMTTYLYHYGKENQTIMGVFTSPVACSENDIHTFSGNRNHRIGLVNLNIESAEDDLERLHESEAEYISTIANLLKTTC